MLFCGSQSCSGRARGRDANRGDSFGGGGAERFFRHRWGRLRGCGLRILGLRFRLLRDRSLGRFELSRLNGAGAIR